MLLAMLFGDTSPAPYRRQQTAGRPAGAPAHRSPRLYHGGRAGGTLLAVVVSAIWAVPAVLRAVRARAAPA